MRKGVRAAAALLLATAGGVAVAQGVPAISASEKAEGAKADPQMVAEFGGAYAGPQAALVRRVGRAVAAQSGIPNAGEMTFTLLNSPVENAFAIPGGYVYVTRALLALMNDEVELAFVLGHETGHVAARHSEKRNQVAQRDVLLGSLGQALLGGLLGGGTVGQIGQSLGQAGINRLVVGHVMSHSRAEEFEADDLGIGYVGRAGYDMRAGSEMLASLAAQNSLDARVKGSARSTPKWAMSHPDPAARVTRALERARALGVTSGRREGDAFLLGLRGMIYGDDPAQGVIEGQAFRLPGEALQFTAPAGYGIENATDAVTVAAADGSGARAKFAGGAYDGNLAGVVARGFAALAGDGQGIAAPTTRTTINGLDAVVGRVSGQDGSGNRVDASVVAIGIGAKAWTFTVIAPQGQGLGALAPLVSSFRRMSAVEVAAVKPRVIEVVTVGRGDTVAGLAARMAYKDLPVERFLVLNGLPAGTASLPVGRRVKIVVWGK